MAEALAENADLADSWKKLDDLGDDVPDGWKRDPDYLKKLDDVVKNGPLNKHIFEGDVKPVIDPNTGLQKLAPDGTKMWSVSGAHSKDALDPNKLRIKGEITPVGNRYYKAKVEAKVEAFTGESYSPNDGWKVKSKESTFFPDSWSKEKVQAEMAYAFNNKTSLGGNKYQGTMSDGTNLTIYLDEAGNVSSAFPEI
ncbi:EndoU domain-containing protein [Fulvivirga sp. 29W222]|uniref:EndoU domain-containing protein n=1 Tax=Fulvivirga marina TaxID=2494733 RepID=A0A937G1S2_9BACT|nr:EndoU domain-containing protein [Fulvivirga marina]MBL6449092.1 EndoU domain-containing protein [Fulvivirga marina]